MNDRQEVTARAAEAYRALADLAETIEDEWQYVTDLVDAYLPSMRALAEADGGRALTAAQVEAVDEAIAEVALIADPHRAIDWLSTLPQVAGLALGGDVDRPAGDGSPGVAIALGGDVDRPAGDVAPAAGSEANEPDEDSPFRILGGYR